MNDLENYKTIIETIFGYGGAKFNTTSDATNNVIGALNNDQFSNFKRCFTERLKRLNEIYALKDNNRKEILRIVNAIATKNEWQGAYSELVAYDFLNKERDFLTKPIKLNTALKAARTYATQLGKVYANIDGFFSDYRVCFEVKSLIDDVDDILKGIYTELKEKNKFPKFLINANYPLDIPTEIIKDKRKEILEELQRGINIKQKTKYVKSKIVYDLEFRLLWEPGILTTLGAYNPCRHAENHYKIAFKYADKFVKEHPFFLVFVIFPWFNSLIIDFLDSNKLFYRSLSRRVFCQYINRCDKLKIFFPKFEGNETLFEVSKKLSGILFLEDKSIDSDASQMVNVDSYFYLNPNAAFKLRERLFDNYVTSIKWTELDDFEYDNY
jgi:hypothetical protein